MISYNKLIILTFCFVVNILGGWSQKTFTPHLDAIAYIEQYKDLAMIEMERTGIPASITLAQGLFESGFGQSELAKKSNNHFGIKCKKEWKGKRVYHDDDEKGECFRKYATTYDSYRDHSNFLAKKKRYKSLFSFQPTNYKAWARGLKKAGYATNPKYAEQLIRYIEDYQLNQYTPSYWAKYKNQQKEKERMAKLQKNNADRQEKLSSITVAAVNEAMTINKLDTIIDVIEYTETVHDEGGEIMLTTTERPAANNSVKTPTVVSRVYSHIVIGKKITVNNVPAICLPKGFSLFELAKKYNIPLASVYKYNDLTFQEYKNDILSQKMLIYLAPKKNKGDVAKHKIRPGETLHDIAQVYGIRLKRLQKLNRLKAGETPLENEVIHLQKYAPSKPHTI